jgi:UDP-N-acetylmuramate dehydrogenase
MFTMPTTLPLPTLRAAFGERLQEHISLAPYTSARIGGPADALLIVASADELAGTVSRLWELDIPYVLLGGGSNMLVSDKGVRGVVVLNRAKAVRFDPGPLPQGPRLRDGVRSTGAGRLRTGVSRSDTGKEEIASPPEERWRLATLHLRWVQV